VGFYDAISPYYDLIFPVDAGTVEFLAERARPGSPSLDAACGTGGHAVALARRGHPVAGIDLDASMIEKARRKGRGLPVRFEVMDMAALTDGPSWAVPGGYGLVYCIGNSLVHLDSEETILRALTGWRRLLAEGGSLVVQIIHYDGILARGAVGLPTIRDERHGLEFVRRYEYPPGGSTVEFHTVLTVREGGEQRRIEGAIPLRILKRATLEALAREAGFLDLEMFGGFDRKPLTLETLPLVLTARSPGPV
jgi:glycine/sarcosine N-methyltransferase